jgi:hypothetical protein
VRIDDDWHLGLDDVQARYTNSLSSTLDELGVEERKRVVVVFGTCDEVPPLAGEEDQKGLQKGLKEGLL